jgi:hypothetical protein
MEEQTGAIEFDALELSSRFFRYNKFSGSVRSLLMFTRNSTAVLWFAVTLFAAPAIATEPAKKGAD